MVLGRVALVVPSAPAAAAAAHLASPEYLPAQVISISKAAAEHLGRVLLAPRGQYYAVDEFWKKN